MSYDIRILREVYDKNYTSNTFEMFRQAFGCKEGIRCLNGEAVIHAKKRLEDAIDFFNNNREELELFNPVNGWGDYESSLELLESMLTNCNIEIEEGYACSEFEVTC